MSLSIRTRSKAGRSRPGSMERRILSKRCGQRQRRQPKKERKHDALHTRRSRLPRAYICPGICLASDSFRALLSSACHVSQRYHHSLWFPLDAAAGRALRVDLCERICPPERPILDARAGLWHSRRGSLLELHHARGRRQECNDLGAQLSPDRNGVYGRAVVDGRTAYRGCLFQPGAEEWWCSTRTLKK